jgi:hypothetical protein
MTKITKLLPTLAFLASTQSHALSVPGVGEVDPSITCTIVPFKGLHPGDEYGKNKKPNFAVVLNNNCQGKVLTNPDIIRQMRGGYVPPVTQTQPAQRDRSGTSTPIRSKYAPPQTPPANWYQQEGYLPSVAENVSISAPIPPNTQRVWDEHKIPCVINGAAVVKDSAVIVDNSTLYNVTFARDGSNCALDPVIRVEGQHNTAEPLVSAIGSLVPGFKAAIASPSGLAKAAIVHYPGVVSVNQLFSAQAIVVRAMRGIPFGTPVLVPAAEGPKPGCDETDTDGDGLTDGEELGQCGEPATSNPRLADTDKDFVPDGDELDEGTYPDNPDSDGDGLNDGGEKLWGTDPLEKDTDGDGFDDFFEVQNRDYGFQPLVPEKMMSAPSFLKDIERGRDIVKGGVCGDICDLDTVPELSGAIAASVMPVVGVVADVRDYFANAVKGDQVSMFFAALGTIPFAGDTARATQMTVRHITRHPEQMQDVFRLVANATYIPEQPRVIMFSTVLAAGDKATAFSLFTQHALQPATVARLSANGARLDSLAKVFDECGNCLKRDVVAAGANGWMANYVDAEKFLRGATTKPTALPPPPRKRTDVRFYDAIVGDVAMEAKTGYVTNNKRVLRQIEKDCGMKGRTELSIRPEWHFFASGASNSIGAAPAVLDALKNCKNGPIPFFFHMP